MEPFTVIRARLEQNWNAQLVEEYWLDHHARAKLLLIMCLTTVRLFPFMPWCLLNILLAMVGVPFPEFIISVFFGSAPFTFYGLCKGANLMTLESNVSDDYITIGYYCLLVAIIAFFSWILCKSYKAFD